MNSWSDYYKTTENNPNFYGKIENERHIAGGLNNYYIYQVNFINITGTSGNGGAIYAMTTRLLIESSTFIDCHSASGKGGALFIDNSNGESFLKMICSKNSSSLKGKCHFCCITTKADTYCTNGIVHSSIAEMEMFEYEGNIVLQKGNFVTLKYNNVSFNKCLVDPVIFCDTKDTFSMMYTCINNNTAENDRVMCLGRKNRDEIINCNIIGNSITQVKGIIIKEYANLNLTNTCMIENNVINENNTMFYIDSPKLFVTITNCTIDSTTKYGPGKLNIDLIVEQSNSFENNLKGFQNHECLFTKDFSILKKCVLNEKMNKKYNKIRKDFKMILIYA